MSGFTLDVARAVEITAKIRIQPISTKPQKPLVRLSATFHGITMIHTGATKMSFVLPIDKKVQVKIEYVDALGNPAPVDGFVAWDTSDQDIVSIEPLDPPPEDEKVQFSNVWIVPGSKVGQAQISAKADADMGDGTKEIITLMDLTVVGGEAVAGVIVPVGELVPKE